MRDPWCRCRLRLTDDGDSGDTVGAKVRPNRKISCDPFFFSRTRDWPSLTARMDTNNRAMHFHPSCHF
jgi:hypothetical protein